MLRSGNNGNLDAGAANGQDTLLQKDVLKSTEVGVD